jgi:hypothetical protein
VGRKLIDSVRHDTVVRDPEGMKAFQIEPMSLRQAAARALRHEDGDFAQTRWSDAFSSAAFRPIRRIGGKAGWYWGNWLWRLRGFIDLFCGGPGLRRGRRDPELLSPGDAVDFWRVEEVATDRLLRLHAEMKLPGRAWLQFEVAEGAGGCVIRQTAIFDPVGLAGLLFWYGIYPLHRLVFAGMLQGIVRAIDEDLREY